MPALVRSCDIACCDLPDSERRNALQLLAFQFSADSYGAEAHVSGRGPAASPEERIYLAAAGHLHRNSRGTALLSSRRSSGAFGTQPPG